MAFNFLAQLLFSLVTLAISVILTPKQKTEPLQPQEFDRPTIEEGAVIRVIFGTCDIRAPHVIWFGDKQASAIWKKASKK